MGKQAIRVVEILLGLLIVAGAYTALFSSEKNPGLVVSVLVLVVIFFGVLKRLSKTPQIHQRLIVNPCVWSASFGRVPLSVPLTLYVTLSGLPQ